MSFFFFNENQYLNMYGGQKYGHDIRKHQVIVMDLLVFLLDTFGLLGDQWCLEEFSLYYWKSKCFYLLMLISYTQM